MMDAKFLDGLYEGDSPKGMRLGMGLTGGDFWPRVEGCSVLYRGSSMILIDFTNILAVADAEASEISPPIYVSHDSGSIYFYVVRRFNHCGYEEHTLVAAVKVSIDTDGELAEPQPNNIFETRAAQVDGNKVQLVWYYCPIKQQSPPTCFNVYYDSGAGQVDYENQIGTIRYAGRKFYSYISDCLDAGKYFFAIRAEDASGIENASLALIRIDVYGERPAQINIIDARAV